MASVAVDSLDSNLLLVPPLLSIPHCHELFCFADVHMDLERDIADFLGTDSSIFYSQGLSTIHCATPAFAKPGDIINFAIQKGLQKILAVAFAGSIIMTSKVGRGTTETPRISDETTHRYRGYFEKDGAP